jgi:predicted DNA-binding transcriptional regulator AlpA
MTAIPSTNCATAARRPLEPLLTTEDLGRLLRVHARSIARMCKRGELPLPLKIGGQNRWKAETIEQALDRFAPNENGEKGPE